MKLARRRLLARSALVAGTLLFSSALRVFARPRASAGGDSRTDALESLFADPDAAAEVGRRYLEIHPGERDLERTLEGLLPTGRAVSRTTLLRSVRERGRADFRGGELAVVDGWVLSRTEARVCAAIAMLRGAARDL